MDPNPIGIISPDTDPDPHLGPADLDPDTDPFNSNVKLFYPYMDQNIEDFFRL